MSKGTSGGMTIDQLIFIVLLCITFAAAAGPTGTLARDMRFGGAVSVGYEFDDRRYEDDPLSDQEQQTSVQTAANNHDQRLSRFRLAPLVTLTSSGERDEIALRYSPSFRYDIESSDNDVDHDLSAKLSRHLTQSWLLKLSDNYLLTDTVYGQGIDSTAGTTGATDTSAGTESTVRLSDNENRRKYWTNNLILGSDYTYRQDSLFSFGYGYRVLENIDTEKSTRFEDFERHELSSALAHRVNSVWKLFISGSYVRGLFDAVGPDQATVNEEDPGNEKDLNEYRAATWLKSNLLEHQTQRLLYNFFGVDYDAPEQNSATIHDLTLGWQWDISKELMFGLGAGPTYTKTEGWDGEWGYNGNLECRYAFERGTIGLTANRGFERQNFTGTDESGLREFWQARLSLNYQLLERLSADLFSSYRYEDEEVNSAVTPLATDQQTILDSTDLTTITETFTRKRFSAGASLSYIFLQRYKVATTYDFSRQDSEKINDSFDEHRVLLVLSYGLQSEGFGKGK